jgi:hypothetical protein
MALSEILGERMSQDRLSAFVGVSDRVLLRETQMEVNSSFFNTYKPIMRLRQLR